MKVFPFASAVLGQDKPFDSHGLSFVLAQDKSFDSHGLGVVLAQDKLRPEMKVGQVRVGGAIRRGIGYLSAGFH